MKFLELCQSRYSVRNFLPKEVENEKIEYILECARLAPSAANRQPWKFVVITDKELIQKVNETYSREWIQSAPIHIVACKSSVDSWKRVDADGKDHADIDAAITSEHIALATHSVGLGTCWVCNFNPKQLKETLSLEEEWEPVVLFPIGYIDVDKSIVPEKKRKEISSIVTWMK